MCTYMFNYINYDQVKATAWNLTLNSVHVLDISLGCTCLMLCKMNASVNFATRPDPTPSSPDVYVVDPVDDVLPGEAVHLGVRALVVRAVVRPQLQDAVLEAGGGHA